MADTFIAATGATVVERVEMPPRDARFGRPPRRYLQGQTGMWLRGFLGGREQVYRHQALALHGLEKRNVVLSTATASGKSLAFFAPAMAELCQGHGRTLVLYPQKALIADQHARWRGELARAGLAPELVGELTGDVPAAIRSVVLDQARVILATPDVLHAWLMPMAASPGVQQFLRQLTLVAIDEAHVLEGVFGSHFCFFFRRLRAAKQRADAAAPDHALPSRELRVVATTATLRDPIAHLQALTGLPFIGVGEAENGAPSHGTSVLHIEGPDRGAPGERMVADTIAAIYDLMPADASVISFADSRQGVERITRLVDRADFVPYRQGYSAADREEIEQGLRSGYYRGTGATSALELGIDLRQFAYGINLGTCHSLKALRQRIGRVGRTRPGLFVVIAPRVAFGALGTSLASALSGPVDPSPIYPENGYIQFQQSCCWLREGAASEVSLASDRELAWPAGFAAAVALAQSDSGRPRELDELAVLGADNPHLAFSLRSMPALTYALKHAHTGDVVGTIDQQKALREAYPGATYYHRRVPYRVLEWRHFSFEQSIRIVPQKGANPTSPLLHCRVSASRQADALIDGHLLSGEWGALFEGQLRVVESVEGYRIGRTTLAYRDLREKDARLNRKQREYQTTGVVLQIDEPWFTGEVENVVSTRRSVAEAIKALLVHEYGIAPAELQTAHSGIAFHTLAGASRTNNTIAIFDTVVGGLRLSAPMFADFAALLARLDRAVTLVGSEALVDAANVERLEQWFNSLKAEPLCEPALVTPGDGRLLIYAPGSRVAVTIRGQSIERELLEPQLVTIGNEEKLMYRYDAGSGGHGWVAGEQLVPLGDDWQRAWWDPVANRLEAIEQVA